MSRHFSLNAWGPYLRHGGDVNVIVLNMEWTPYYGRTPYYSVTFGLFGFCACLTWWPRGKYLLEDLGGQPVYPGREKAP